MPWSLLFHMGVWQGIYFSFHNLYLSLLLTGVLAPVGAHLTCLLPFSRFGCLAMGWVSATALVSVHYLASGTAPSPITGSMPVSVPGPIPGLPY